jgi:ABC-type enterochelin transport system permease subunit
MGRLLRQFLQGLVLGVFLAELGLFMYYFLGPNREQQYMISDRIFASGEYMAALSAFLGFRLLVVVVYSLNYVREQPAWVTTTFVASGLAAGGWSVLEILDFLALFS